jgi:hypothetical protein
VDTRQLFLQDFCLFPVEATTAIPGWPCRNRPAFFGHALQPETLILTLERPVTSAPTGICFGPVWVAHGFWAIGFQPIANFLSE